MSNNMRHMPMFFGRVLLFALGFVFLGVWPKLFTEAQLSPLIIALNFVGGFVLALLLAWILPQTRLRRLDLIAVVWFSLFVIQMFSNMLEGYFFTSVFPSALIFARAVLFSLFTTMVEAVMAGVLFLSVNPDKHLFSDLSSYFGERALSSWSWRIAAASLAYFPIYFTFGALISPFVIPYYTDPSSGLRIPPFTVIIPLEFLRGLLYVVALLPFLAVIRGSRRTLYFVIVSLLFVPGALVPLITEPSLPMNIVPFHGVEILADSFVYGAVITRLLGRRSSDTYIDS